jgi:Penicillin V acylase and related amidases
MCTSFSANFNNYPIYGMNFDYPETELKLSVDTYDGNPFFVMAFKAGESFINTVGMNRKGLFISLQMLPDDNSDIKKPSPDNFPAILLINEVLKKSGTVEDVLGILDKKRFVVLRKPKGHALVADITGSSVIIEEGNDKNEITVKNNDFQVMTNFYNADFAGKRYEEVYGFGADRYIKAFEMLNRKYEFFDINDGFNVLKHTSTSNSDFQTLFSAIFCPHEASAYISLNRDFGLIWKLSLDAKTLAIISGYKDFNPIELDSSGISSYFLLKHGFLDT